MHDAQLEKIERSLSIMVKLVDGYEEVCGVEGLISWVEYIHDYDWPTEQQCIDARGAMRALRSLRAALTTPEGK